MKEYQTIAKMAQHIPNSYDIYCNFVMKYKAKHYQEFMGQRYLNHTDYYDNREKVFERFANMYCLRGESDWVSKKQ